MAIRRNCPADAPAIVAGINAICVEGGAFITTRFIPSPVWQAVLDSPEAVPGYFLGVAEWQGAFAGACRLFPGPEHSLFHHVVELGMFVLSPYRRLGIGRDLLATGMAWAAEQGYKKITLVVLATNEPAINLYQSAGFQEEGRLREQIKEGDHYLDLLQMAYFVR